MVTRHDAGLSARKRGKGVNSVLCVLAIISLIGISQSAHANDSKVNFPASIREVSLATGYDYACAILATGAVRCWGSNEYGQLSVPTDLGAASQISGGSLHTCAIVNDGAVRCWGDNRKGQASAPVDLTNAIQISSGYDHSCALTGNGTPYCWGNNNYGQRSIPSGLGAVVQIAAGKQYTCALLVSGNYKCWGGGIVKEYSITGDGSAGVTYLATYDSSIAFLSGGKAYLSGWNANGTMKVPSDFGPVSQVSVGFNHLCALDFSGKVGCWGSDITTIWGPVPANLGPVTQISASEFFTCAVTFSEEIKCWGLNESGRTAVPEQIGTQWPILRVAAIEPVSLVVRVDGEVSVGTVLTALATSEEPGTQLQYQWCVDDSQISGANESSYKLPRGFYGRRVFVRVTGSKPGFITTTQISTPVEVGLGQFSLIPVPKLEGSGKIDSVLSASIDPWNEDVQLSYSWLRDNAVIPNETTGYYKIIPSDIGHKLSFRVSATLPGYISATSTSAQVSAVAGDLVSTPNPKLVGFNSHVGTRMFVSLGQWDDNVGFRYQWLKDGAPIPGQIGPTYILAPQDLGREVSVKVTGVKFRYTAVQRTSDSILVDLGSMEALPPKIVGIVKVGSLVRYSNTAWVSGAKANYEWLIDGKQIKGSAGKPFKILPKYKGHKLSLRVTQTAPGYRTLTLSSIAIKVG